jgi:hypothetical protein
MAAAALCLSPAICSAQSASRSSATQGDVMSHLLDCRWALQALSEPDPRIMQAEKLLK